MSSIQILWVDDEIELLKPHILFLERKNYKVTTCTNGADAIDLVSEQNFDIVFLDENMPGLQGSEVAEQLCFLEGNGINKSTPKISLTGLATEEAVNNLYKKGFTHHIQKPVTKAILDNFLKSWSEGVKI